MELLYYTIDVEFHNNNFEMGPTGWKTIRVYRLDTKVPTDLMIQLMAEIEATLESVSIDEIQVWLDNNEYEDEFEFESL